MGKKCKSCHEPVKGHKGPWGDSCKNKDIDEAVLNTSGPISEASNGNEELNSLKKDMQELKEMMQQMASSSHSQAKGAPPLAAAEQQTNSLMMAGEQFDKIANTFASTLDPLKSIADCTVPPIDSIADPRALLTVKSQNKATHITDFLSETTKLRIKSKRQSLILQKTTEQGNLQVTCDDKHPYGGITLSEWGGANMRLLNHILTTGYLERRNIEFYMSYTATIFDFYENFQWHSVLEFDFYYRELQAAHGFQWGFVSPMLQLHILKPLTQSKVQTQTPTSRQPQQPRQDCRQWLANGGNCRFGAACRYRHPALDQSEVQTGAHSHVTTTTNPFLSKNYYAPAPSR